MSLDGGVIGYKAAVISWLLLWQEQQEQQER
jgi:hypothetical protein